MVERFYDKTTRTEVLVASHSTLSSLDNDIAWWFEPLPMEYTIVYAEDGTPYKYKGDFTKPIIARGRVVEGEDAAVLLENVKKEKRKEIKEAKKVYQSRPVLAKVGGVDYNFFGGIESARKYKDAMDLAISLGLTEGTIKTLEGMVSINREDMNIALQAVSLQSYKGWLKESYYNVTIDALQSITEVESVVWEDVR